MESYGGSTGEKVLNLENFLADELQELKNEIEEKDMVFGSSSRPISSVLLPKHISYFKEERKRAIAKMLNVSDAPQLKNQGKIMSEEIETALGKDITNEGLPLLLHQFFLDRVQSLVQCKHLHLLRWRRFCQHTAMVERLYEQYKQILEQIDVEYNDAKNRAFRLSSAHTAFINGEKECMKCVDSDDIRIYLRWIVNSLRSVRKQLSYIKILQWFPIIHRNSIDLLTTSYEKPMRHEGKSSESFQFQFQTDSAPSIHIMPSLSARSMDKAFTGMLSNELTHTIPLHTLDLINFRAHLEALASEYGIPVKTDLATSADEMELFGAVNRQFKRLFNLQEECMTFYPYDFVPEGNEHWGIDSPIHSLLKQCNWTPYVNILPHKNALQEKQMMQLKQSGVIDELLVSHNKFLEVSDYSCVVESLKEHASAVQKPPAAKSLQVTTHRQGELRSADILANIYNNPQLSRGNPDQVKGSEAETEVNGRDQKKKDDYNFSDTMQLLGLDESEDTASTDPSVVQGAYLSFLHLRTLKLRDVRRQCLSLLNYFRSVERSITIYDNGLSLEGETSGQEKGDSKMQKGGKSQKSKSKTLQATKSSVGHGGSRGLGSHHYVNNTPLDFKVEENEFMEFSSIANHDDFYQLEEEETNDDGIDTDKRMHITAAIKKGLHVPHVQDQRGYFIVYELAVKDFKKIENDILLLASHFINKHEVSGDKNTADINLAAYAHQDVDRFAVLLDAWMCEVNFLHNKRELLDCYLEAYSNTFDPEDRRAVAQAMTDVIHLRPRQDLTADYFIAAYKLECACLRLKMDLVKQVLNSQIQENRQHGTSAASSYGLGSPNSFSMKQPIAVNLPKPSLLHMSMFEFHPTLGVTASRLTDALRLITQELTLAHKPSNQTEAIIIEKQILQIAIHEWEEMSKPGISYSAQVQKEIFSDHFIGDSKLIEDVVDSTLVEESDTETTDEKRIRKCNAWKTALDAVLLHHRLREAAWETEILARMYKHVAQEMGYGEYHMYIRLSQFEYAAPKPKADPAPSTLTKFVPEDSAADRYIPNHIILAIHELDENHLPVFSFYNKSSFSKILTKQSVLENIRIALASQLSHRNSLIVAVLQAVTCMNWKETTAVTLSEKKASLLHVADTHESTHSISSNQSLTSARSRSGSFEGNRGTQNFSSKLNFGFQKQKKTHEAFISLQREKTGPRDVMVNNFIKKKESSGMLLQKEGELPKLKRELVSTFCKEYTFRMGIHAMRTQIVACYSCILSLLGDLPKVRDSYFVMGRPNEKKRKLDDVEGMIPDAKSLHRRPRRVLSSGGTDLLNLWFIPHYTEVLFSFRNKDYKTQHNILLCWLEIASSLRDILQCLHAHARLGNSLEYTVSADWGGSEGVAAELAEIQKQIESLGPGTSPHSRNPSQVAELLKIRKDVMFLEFDAAVRQYIRILFLETENQSAFDGVTNGMHFALPALSNVKQPSLFQFFFNVPEPMEPHEAKAKMLYPWLSFEGSNGEFPLMYRTHWRDVENCMQLCLASLDDNERKRANGEIIGASMLYHDILQGGPEQLRSLNEPLDPPKKGFIAANPLGSAKHTSRPASAAVPDGETGKPDGENEGGKDKSSLKAKTDTTTALCKIRHPIISYKLIKLYFLLCKQTQGLKEEWIKKKLHIQKVDKLNIMHEGERIYFSEIYFPILQMIARDMGFTEYYSDVVSWEDNILPPSGAPEITVQAKQLLKLLETIECLMIEDVRHQVSKEFSLVLAERSREEAALPTDLWKKSSIEETFTVNRPTIVEDFLHELMNDYTEENGKITFSSEHLNKCMFNLSASVMKREKQNYEMYSTFYENLLHHNHQLLYQKERELHANMAKSLTRLSGSQIQTQFEMADRSQQLILEITALRSAVTEMRNESQIKDQMIREEVRAEYQELVHKLFEECFQMKAKLAQYHTLLYKNMHSLVSDTRRESMHMLENLRNKNLNSAADERIKILQAKDELVKKAELKNTNLKIVLGKLLAFNHWRRSASTTHNRTKFQTVSSELSKCKKELQMLHLVSSQNQSLLEEQLQCARKALDASEVRLNKVYSHLERQQRLQKEKEYREAKEEKNRRELSEAQKKNLDHIVTELKEKDKRLQLVSSDSVKMARANEAANSKTRRKVKTIRNQLEADRVLKLEAFNRVDDLQAHVWDFEQAYSMRAGSVSMSRPTSAAISHSKSFLGVSALQPDAQSTVISVNTPPYTPRFKTRPLSSVAAYQGAAHQEISMPRSRQRPRTSTSAISRIDGFPPTPTNSVGKMALEEIFAKHK